MSAQRVPRKFLRSPASDQPAWGLLPNSLQAPTDHTQPVLLVPSSLTCLPTCNNSIDPSVVALVAEKFACMQGVPRRSQDPIERGTPHDAGYGAGLRPPHGHPKGGGFRACFRLHLRSVAEPPSDPLLSAVWLKRCQLCVGLSVFSKHHLGCVTLILRYFIAAAVVGEDLHKMLWLKSRNSEVWLERRTGYTRSTAVMSMVGYLLGLGDRHPSNLMLDRYSGKLLHIDFGDCFEVSHCSTLHLK